MKTIPYPTPESPVGVVLDMDGTLASTHSVSDFAIDVLARLQDRGLIPILLTGRAETSPMDVAKAAGLTSPFVSNAGGLITSPTTGERLHEFPIDPGVVAGYIDYALDHGLLPFVFQPDEYFTVGQTWASAELSEINSAPVTILDNPDELPRDHVLKMVFAGDPDHIRLLSDDLARCCPLMKLSLDRYLEGSAPASTKANSLAIVLDILGLTTDRCLGFGDGVTDVAWLSQMAYAVAPDNAFTEVKDVVDDVIEHHSTDSVARFLAETYLS